MSQLRELGKKLCLNKSKQKSFDSRDKQKSSSMQSFVEKVGSSEEWQYLLVLSMSVFKRVNFKHIFLFIDSALYDFLYSFGQGKLEWVMQPFPSFLLCSDGAM